MDDTELAFRCVELAVKNGAQGDPGPLAGIYFAAVKRLTPGSAGDSEADTSPSHADKPGAKPGPATAGKTARRTRT